MEDRIVKYEVVSEQDVFNPGHKWHAKAKYAIWKKKHKQTKKLLSSSDFRFQFIHTYSGVILITRIEEKVKKTTNKQTKQNKKQSKASLHVH